MTNPTGSAEGTRRAVVVSEVQALVVREGFCPLAAPGWTVFYEVIFGQTDKRMTFLKVSSVSEGRDYVVADGTVVLGGDGQILLSAIKRVLRRSGVVEPVLTMLARELVAEGPIIWRRMERAAEAARAVMQINNP